MRTFLENLQSCFDRSGYHVDVKDDLQEFAALRSNTPDHVFMGPTFDPTVSDQSRSRWIYATTHSGEPAAFVAVRRFDGPDITSLVKSGHIWYDKPDFGHCHFLKREPEMAGTAFYRGGMYVFPEHRKAGLAWGLAIYGQAIAQQEGADWIMANAFPEIVNKGIPTRVYGFEAVHPQIIKPLPGLVNEGKTPLDVKKRDYLTFSDGYDIFYFLTCSKRFFDQNITVGNRILIAGTDKNLLDVSLAYQRDRMPQKDTRRFG